MKVFYDFHIHTDLSPCGDVDMTPNNIVNMAIIKGLDVIAISDHNAIGNVKPILEVAEGTDLIVFPAMEIETSEEIHILSIFYDLESAEKCFKTVKDKLIKIKNKTETYGHQHFYDKEDNIIGEENNLLVIATQLSIDEVKKLVDDCGGVAIPAHIDRNSYSVLSNLGMIPKELNFSFVELSKKADTDFYGRYGKYIINSDAHYLCDISEKENYLNLPEKSKKEIFKYLKTHK